MMQSTMVQHQERFKQPLLFDGLKYGTWYPTDIDGMMELGDKAYCFLEVKRGEKELPTGQRLALQRLVHDTGRNGKQSVALVVTHDVADPREPIYLKDCIIREVYYSGNLTWYTPTQPKTVEEVLGKYIAMVK